MIGGEEDVMGNRQGGGCQGTHGGRRMSGRKEDVMGDRQGEGCHG